MHIWINPKNARGFSIFTRNAFGQELKLEIKFNIMKVVLVFSESGILARA